MNIEAITNLIGETGRSINDFHIYHSYLFIQDDKQYMISTVFVDGQYIAFLVDKETNIILKEIIYAREKYNLYQMLFNKTGIKEYDDMVNEKITSMSTD